MLLILHKNRVELSLISRVFIEFDFEMLKVIKLKLEIQSLIELELDNTWLVYTFTR